MARPTTDQETKPVTAATPPKSDKDHKQATGSPAQRGELTPTQYDDDGWGDTPVQMR